MLAYNDFIREYDRDSDFTPIQNAHRPRVFWSKREQMWIVSCGNEVMDAFGKKNWKDALDYANEHVVTGD